MMGWGNRKINGEEHAFHINVPSDGYTRPYTPLPGCF